MAWHISSYIFLKVWFVFCPAQLYIPFVLCDAKQGYSVLSGRPYAVRPTTFFQKIIIKVKRSKMSTVICVPKITVPVCLEEVIAKSKLPLPPIGEKAAKAKIIVCRSTMVVELFLLQLVHDSHKVLFSREDINAAAFLTYKP